MFGALLVLVRALVNCCSINNVRFILCSVHQNFAWWFQTSGEPHKWWVVWMVASTLLIVHYITERLPLLSTKDSAKIPASHPTRRFLIIQNIQNIPAMIASTQYTSTIASTQVQWEVSIMPLKVGSVSTELLFSPSFSFHTLILLALIQYRDIVWTSLLACLFQNYPGNFGVEGQNQFYF